MKLVVWGDVRILLPVCVDLFPLGSRAYQMWIWVLLQLDVNCGLRSTSFCKNLFSSSVYFVQHHLPLCTVFDLLHVARPAFRSISSKGEIMWRFDIFTALKLALVSLWWVYIIERRWLAKCQRNSLHPPRSRIWRCRVLWDVRGDRNSIRARRFRVRTPVVTSFSAPVRTGPEASPVYCVMSAGFFFPGGKTAGAWRWPSTHV